MGDACVACATALPEGAKFCAECGTPVASRRCSTCGLPAQGRFCTECGSPVDVSSDSALATDGSPPDADRPRSERRITTVLFGDLVGFTTLSEARDSEDVRDLLTRYFDGARRIVERHGGTIEKFIGDAVMAVWGVPTAHEDDAERAVRAGVELVEMAHGLGDDIGTPVQMRVGLVTGEVTATIGAAGQGMVAGDAVNTASRVQSSAAPGSVWVDETTKTLTAAAIAYDDVGEHALKGKRQAVQLYAVRAVVASVGGGDRIDGLEAPLVGRDREVRLLKELFHSAEERDEPALVLVEGDAGIGKTRLGWEFEKYVDGLTQTVRWHRGRCLAYGEGVSYWALAEALRGRFELVERDLPDVAARHLDDGLAQYVPDEQERTWLRPRVGVLLGLPADETFSRDELYAAWTALLGHIGSDGPVVLVIDDAQHADDGLLDFVDHLLNRSENSVFVVLLARPGVLTRRPTLAAHHRASVLHVRPLASKDMADLVDGLAAGLPDPTRDLLVQRAEGVPLFAVETVRSLIDQDLVVATEGRYAYDHASGVVVGDLAVPASLQTLVAARLDALSPDERRLVADASVLGTTFALDDLLALAPDVDQVGALADLLVAKQIWTVETDRFSAERGQFRFVHGVVRQVAYDTLSRRDRRARHLAVATRLLDGPRADDEAAVAAQHVLDAVAMSTADDPERQTLLGQARDLLVDAARRARELGAHGTSLRYLEQALTFTDDAALEGDLRLATWRAADGAGRFDEAIEHARRAGAAFTATDQPARAGLAAAYEAQSLRRVGDSSRAVAVARPHYERLVDEPGADDVVMELAHQLANAESDLGRSSETLTYRLHQIRLADARDDRMTLARGITNVATDFEKAGLMRLGRILRRAGVDLARELGQPSLLSMALFNYASGRLAWDAPQSVQLGREAMAAARLSGDVFDEAFSRGNLMLALWVTGDWTDLDDLMLDPTELTEDMGQLFRVMKVWTTAARSGPLADVPDVSLPSGQFDELFAAWQLHLRSLHLRHAGDTAAALEAAVGSVDLSIGVAGLEEDTMHFLPLAVDVALDAGRIDLAADLLSHVEAAPPGLRPPALAAHLLALRGRLRAARGDEPHLVESDLRAAIAAYRDYGSPVFAANAQEALGVWLLEQGRADEAAEHLDAARTAYERFGARAWVQRLDAATRSEVSRTV